MITHKITKKKRENHKILTPLSEATRGFSKLSRNWLQRQKHKHLAIFDLEKDPLPNKQQLRDFYFSKKVLMKKNDLTDKRLRNRLLSKEGRILKRKEKKEIDDGLCCVFLYIKPVNSALGYITRPFPC
jgi:hypothetical protein